ncbi:MAG: DUF4920 domain-containing protein [Bacteroidetes bacterium]|nr:DUF4920 domain-containing protein [Bacteroidota bacterium]
MKYNLIFSAAFFFVLTSCGTQKTEQVSKYFGDSIAQINPTKVADVKAKLGTKDSVEMQVEGKIVEVCQKKGCWMELQLDNSETMRVTFKDYAFFIPKDAAGKTVIMEGYAYNDTTSVQMLRHYAEDGGESQAAIDKITEPEVAVVFEASGVIIK